MPARSRTDAENSPSAWPHRLWMLGLCVSGATIAAYLTAVQLHWMGNPWDPFFGGGSEKVLFSALSRKLPFPDASAGLLAYVLEGILLVIGNERRWQEHPNIVLTSALLMAAAAATSASLLVFQIFYVRAYCFLCLMSAAMSIGLFLLSIPEAIQAWRWVHGRRGDF